MTVTDRNLADRALKLRQKIADLLLKSDRDLSDNDMLRITISALLSLTFSLAQTFGVPKTSFMALIGEAWDMAEKEDKLHDVSKLS